ncbi:MAG TPA: DUF3810 domain-containing protein [Chitinophagaceae bacterium]|nr:DUF3810 domain-containing protein [Chitinophagaceae bacterium]
MKFVILAIIFTAGMKIRNKAPKRRWIWLGILLLIIILIKIFSAHSPWVEAVYTTKVYWAFSSFLRLILGWLPLSFGDILYILAAVWIIWKLWRFSAKLFRRRLTKKWFAKAGYQLLVIAMSIYIIFNIFWGINYNRKEIAEQLNLQITKKDTADLKTIERLLIIKVNESKQALVNKGPVYPTNKELFKRAVACYQQAEKIYPFLSYKTGSVKRSMFGLLGNYFGFTGYYNPFTGEAQVNTRMPKFILPYTTSHEIAHQLGYAKEEEANFVGYLAATSSRDTLFHYSTYLDLFIYANRQLFFLDSIAAKDFTKQLLPEVKADIAEWKKFVEKYKSPLEPIIRWAYGNYLRANQQPKGMTSYDEVIADLIAFYKKYGKI